MHRTTLVPRCLLAIVLIALGYSAYSISTNAQGPEQPAPGVLVLQVNSTKKVGMSTNALLSNVAVENPRVCRVQTLIEDPRAVLVTGVAPGATRVTLTDDKKQSETFEVRVLADEETAREQQRKDLMELIRKAVPTASVNVIASPNNTVTLSGKVANPQTVQVILELARSVFGTAANVVNSLQIGGVQQVQVEVVIATVNRSEVRNIGFSFLGTGSSAFLASTVSGAGSLIANGLASIHSPTAALSSTPNAVFGVINDRSTFLGFLTALRTEGLAKIYSEPYVTTLSGRPGYIVSGGKTPVLTSTGTGAPNVSYEQFGTVVNFLPIVLDNGKIHLEVRPEISNIDAAAGINIPSTVGVTSVPGFDIRSAQAAVQLEDGQTLAIGGLVQNRINATANKVPILGDLPLVGIAFSNKQYTESEEELIILVTPRLVHPLDCRQIPPRLPGRETRSPDDFELFLEGILEAPRGPRQVHPPYTAAHRGGPTSGIFPCGDSCSSWHGIFGGTCGIRGGCNNGCNAGCNGGANGCNVQGGQQPISNALPGSKMPQGNKEIRPAADSNVTPPVRVIPTQEEPVLPPSSGLPPAREVGRESTLPTDQELPVLPPLPPAAPPGENSSGAPGSR